VRGRIHTSLRCWLGLAVCLPMLAAYAGEPVLQVGFDGHFKSEHWFPVTITSAGGARQVSLEMIEAGYGMGGYERKVTAVYRAGQDPDTGLWQGLVYAPDSHRENLLRAVITMPDGSEQVVESLIKGFDRDTTLLLVVTDTPDAFSFLRMLEQGRRRVTLVVAQDANLLQRRDWRDFAGVDAVVLDGPAALSSSDQQALRHWVQQGGSVILTDQAWGRPGGTWGLGDREMPDPVEVDGGLLAGLLPQPEAVVSFRRRPKDLPGFVPVFGDAEGTLVGTRDFGWGRVVGLGFAWQSVVLRDRALQETVRRDLWSGILGLLREDQEQARLGMDAVIPQEAQVKSLVWPILIFLGICALILGPLNWLVLLRMRRLEYTALTLPLGALVLSVLALGLGIVWRPRHVIVEEVFVAAGHGDGVHARHGASGIFSPVTGAYRVEVARPGVLLHEARLQSWRSWGEEMIAADTIYQPGRHVAAIDGIAIDRWAMRFVQTTEMLPQALGLEARARVVGVQQLEGTVANQSDAPLEHVQVVFRQFRVAVGRLAPGETRSFVLDLDPEKLSLGERCPGCGGYHHGGDPFVTREGEDPLPRQLTSQGGMAVRWACAGREVPAVVGLQEVTEPFVKVTRQAEVEPAAVRGGMHMLRPEVEYRRALLLAAPVAMDWSASAYIPEGFARVVHLPRVAPDMAAEESQMVWQQHLRRVPAADQAAVLALAAAFRQQDTLQTSVAVVGRGAPARQSERSEAYLLPASLAGQVLVEWAFEDHAEAPEAQEDPEPGIMLEVYDWEAKAWHVLAQAAKGRHPFRFATSSAFIMPGHAVVVLRQRVLTVDTGEVDPFLLHTHGVGIPSLHQASLKVQVVPEGVPDV